MIKVLNHEVPDRLPTFEYAIDQKIIQGICPGGNYADVVEKLDLDAITAWEPSIGAYVPGMAGSMKPGERFVDEWGVEREATGEMYAYPVVKEPLIKNEIDLENYSPPDPLAEHRFDDLRQYIERFKGTKLITYSIIDMFELSKFLMGLEEYLMAWVLKPDLIKKLYAMTTEWVIQVACKAVDIGADMIIEMSDIAYKTGLFMKPEQCREIFIPCLKRVVEAVKQKGAYVFYHTHGDIRSIIDDLVDTGIDVLNPIDPDAGMDIEEVKTKFGNKVVLGGNISTDALSRKSPEEVEQLVNQTIAKASKGGGHILMGSSSMLASVKSENYMMMVKTAQNHTY
jgi:uroporphyrinogen decarboxylase